MRREGDLDRQKGRAGGVQSQGPIGGQAEREHPARRVASQVRQNAALLDRWVAAFHIIWEHYSTPDGTWT
jgi:hypothetical protein